MSDLISRNELTREVWKRANNMFSEWDTAGVLNLISNAPTVEAKPIEWIPVTELDLDHNQEALIKLDDGFVCSARFLIADNSNYCGFYNKHIGFLQCPQVVEWMPYREKVE